jgi:hypothetical protein
VHPKEEGLVEPTEFDPEPPNNGLDSKVASETAPDDSDWGDDVD